MAAIGVAATGIVAVVANAVGAPARRPSSPADAAAATAGDPPPATPAAAAGRGGTPVDPTRFATSACVSLPPTTGNRHETVFVDAGHGGIDPGAVGTTGSGQQVLEADVTLPVELDVAAELRAVGFTVVVSRTAATNVARLTPADESDGMLTVLGAHDDVAARAECANEGHADLLLGIYFDAGGSPGNAGCVTGYDTARTFSAANMRFADLLQDDTLAAMNRQGWGIPNEGALVDSALGSASSEAAVSYGHLLLLGPAETGYFSTPSQMPGALVEPLFVTDPFEASLAVTGRGQQVMADGMAAAVEQYFGATPAGSGR